VTEAGAEFDDEALIIQIHRSYAHPGGVYIYRVTWYGKSVVYATDTEGYVGIDRRLVNFAQGADVLIHDAQYVEEHYRGQRAGLPTTQGFGHSTVTMACEVAIAAKVDKLLLFHHDPANDDAFVARLEADARSRFANSWAAHEGLEVELSTLPSDSRLNSERIQTIGKRDVKYAHNG